MSVYVEAPVSTIRQCLLSDVEGITALLHSLSYPTTTGVMQERIKALQGNNDACMLIAQREQQILGIIELRCVQSYAYPEPSVQIANLVVCHTGRVEGVPNRLVACAEQWSRECGGKQLFVVGVHRERDEFLYHFYKQLGFRNNQYRFCKPIVF